MMRYSSTVPSDSDTHDDFKPTQKVPSGSTDSLKDIVENVSLKLFLDLLHLVRVVLLMVWVVIGCEGESCYDLHERSSGSSSVWV